MNFMINYEQYSVIGDPIQCSISPFIHRTIFNYFNEEYKMYSKLKITSDGLVYNFSLLKSNFQGFNITSPHKINIIKYLDELDDFSKKIGCVNTVKVSGGKAVGYNTDIYGFLKGLGDYKDKISGNDILVLGSGATSRVVISSLIDLGANVYVCARNIEKLNALKKLMYDIHDGYEINTEILDKVQGTYFGVVNTINLTSNFDLCGVDISNFVYDVNYNVGYITNFLRKFSNENLTLIDGRNMVFYQAIKSQEIWRGCKMDQDDISNIYKEFIKIFSEE